MIEYTRPVLSHAAWGAALLRIVLGVIFVAHGYLALTQGPSGTATLIVQLGYPEEAATALAWYLILVHGVGGLMLIVGLWTTAAAVAQVPIMASALFLRHWPQGFFLHGVVDPSTGRATAAGYEYTLLVLAATLALAVIGPGALSLDERRRHRGRRSRAFEA